MPDPVDVSYPGVFVEEIASGAKPITGVATSICAFVGHTLTGPARPLDCFSDADFRRAFRGRASGYPLGDAIEDFFRNGGRHAVIVGVPEPGAGVGNAASLLGDPLQPSGIYALDAVDLFNLLCIPSDPAGASDDELRSLHQAAAAYCQKRRAMLLLDPPAAWSERARQGRYDLIQPSDLGITGPELERNCAVYFPRIRKLDSASGQSSVFPACGAIAGIFARTDASRGVWTAPAGTDARVNGIAGLEFDLIDNQNERLNPLGINCLRQLPEAGPVLWGARTLRGANVLSDDYKYVPVRRLALYIEGSISRGIQFAAFEPNGEMLWAKLRRIVVNFMDDLLRQGASYGHYVACDSTTTTLDDIEHGIVNLHVGFAPLKPAEFVVLRFQQQAGQGTLQRQSR